MADEWFWVWEHRGGGIYTLRDTDGNKAGLVVGRTYRLCDRKGNWLGPAIEVSSATGPFLQLNALAKDLCLVAAKSLRETKAEQEGRHGSVEADLPGKEMVSS